VRERREAPEPDYPIDASKLPRGCSVADARQAGLDTMVLSEWLWASGQRAHWSESLTDFLIKHADFLIKHADFLVKHADFLSSLSPSLSLGAGCTGSLSLAFASHALTSEPLSRSHR
jgi:hypothetical protein